MFGSSQSGRTVAATALRIACCVAVAAGALLVVPPGGQAADPPGLVLSELVTGGASASDEFIEIYNAADVPASLAGLELVYVTATGTTITRRATWTDGSLPPHAHLLVANEAGIYRTIADALYSSGLSSTGGSVALRPAGGDTPVDAVGWGTASSSWMEGSPAPAPAAGASIERLPGGPLGSITDTHDNSRDFVERVSPEPQNTGSEPTPPPGDTSTPAPSVTLTPTMTSVPTAHPTPTPVASAAPTAAQTATPSSPTPSVMPGPAATPIAEARAMPDGSSVTIEGTALTASTFTDGGGYVWDGSGGIAVLLAEGGFSRGEVIRVTGVLDDRYHQRTLRANNASITGTGSDPSATTVATGSVAESSEAHLVRVSGEIIGSGTDLVGGRAFDLDDGTGPVRVLIASSSGVATARWTDGARVDLTGVVGQRDSSGTGTAGYRVMPRDDADVHAVTPAPTPSARPTSTPRTPTASPSRSGGPSATRPPAANEPLLSIAAARASDPGTVVRVRGIVTAERALLLDDQSAAIQDATGALLLRVPDDVSLAGRGELVEISGERSTKSGMVTVRVESATPLGRRGEPAAASVTTGSVAGSGENLESELVRVRGVLGSVRRSSAGNVSFTVDDGSGPLRGFVFASTETRTGVLTTGSWVELRGVLGQDTSGDRPNEGYRVWPRGDGDVRLVAPATEAGGGGGGSETGDVGDATSGAASAASPVDLGALIEAGAAGAEAPPARATLVAGSWPEIEVAGVLWDGSRAVVMPLTPAAGEAVERTLGGRPPPAVVDVAGATSTADLGPLSAPAISVDGGTLEPVVGRPAAPATEIPVEDAPAVWARVAGLLRERDGRSTLDVSGTTVGVTLLCDEPATRELWESLHGDAVIVEGILAVVDDAPQLVAPCAGVAASPELVARRTAARASRPGGDRAAASLARTAGPDGLLIVAGVVSTALAAVVAAAAWRTGTIGRLIAQLAGDRTDAGSDGGVPPRRGDASLHVDPPRRDDASVHVESSVRPP